jgi:hypothetical protein
VRNDAGHPLNAYRITPDAVHASYLVFLELARFATDLQQVVPLERLGAAQGRVLARAPMRTRRLVGPHGQCRTARA